jgi:predicted nucleotidyltransferase component of viral defense system
VSLDLAELQTVAEQFGVSDEQVRRDHVISHLLALISVELSDDILFFGGTALARTHLPDGRLSEDLDFIALSPRPALASALDNLLPRGASRATGALRWNPSLAAVRDTDSAILEGQHGVRLRVQLMRGEHYAPWPTEQRALHQRYADAPGARLRVPTRAAFAAWKTATWADRRAPRDLWDLYALAGLGGIDRDAFDLYRKHGPTNRPPSPDLFHEPPREEAWRAALAGQMRLSITAAQALADVRTAWGLLS